MRPAPRIPALYAFRKPFSAATFALVPGWTFALDYKIALVIAQVAGYALSKLIGIKVISELDPAKRASAIIVLILLSWAALVLFALIPVPWNVAAMFLNGLPLGMIWGLVFGFMEGRRTSEVLGAVVCASFIVSSGAVKSVGKLLMANWHVSPFWMPAAAGALFLPLLLLSVLALSALPPPNALDEAAIFTASELPVAILALSTLGFIITVRDNTRALMVIHAVIVAGLALLGGSTWAFQAGWLGSCALLIWRNFGLMQLNWLQVFTASAYGTSILGMVLVGLSAVYFLRKAATVNP
jgi:hypothetical protein